MWGMISLYFRETRILRLTGFEKWFFSKGLKSTIKIGLTDQQKSLQRKGQKELHISFLMIGSWGKQDGNQEWKQGR
jgi:hypothetical protein